MLELFQASFLFLKVTKKFIKRDKKVKKDYKIGFLVMDY